VTGPLLKRTLALLFGLWFALAATAQPARIILLRHAEKPADETDIHLSERGRERAQALTAWATDSPVWGTNDQPVAVFACKPTPEAPSQRAIKTITPLATRLGLSVQTPFSAKNYAALAQQILNDPALNGKSVVICWVRDELPLLAQSFGVKSGGKKWKKDVFDRVWLITFRDSVSVLNELPQQLLPRDTGN
jgi:hypothetical protein